MARVSWKKSKMVKNADTVGGAARLKRPHRVTAAEVAAAAGVSRSAVSRAFTPGAYLDEKKREIILRTALQLGYRPNALAASLQGIRTNMVAVVAGDISNLYDGEFVAQLVAALNAVQKWPMVLSGSEAAHDQNVLSVLQYPLDALIVRGGSVSPAVLTSCKQLNIPLILSGRVLDDPAIDCICCRNEAGAAMAASRLIRAGRTKFGYVGGPDSWSSNLERFQGAAGAQANAGSAFTAVCQSDYSFEGGRQAAETILTSYEVDALICANDAMALGALSYIRTATALRVPQDISIVGFDDIGLAGWPNFNLTTIRNPLEVTIPEIIRLLDARLADPARRGEVVWIDPILIERGTH